MHDGGAGGWMAGVVAGSRPTKAEAARRRAAGARAARRAEAENRAARPARERAVAVTGLGLELTDAESAALAAVVAGRVAWTPWDAPAGAPFAGLVVAGWLEPWDRGPDGLHVTLTPWAADRLGVTLRERWVVTSDARDPDDRGRPVREGPKLRYAYEVPYWAPKEYDEHGEEVLPISPPLPEHAHERNLPSPARVVDPKSVETLKDDDDKEVRLFAGEGGAGFPVRVVAKLRGKRGA